MAFCDNTGEFHAGRPAAREYRFQHRRRPHHRARPGPGPDPRPTPPRPPDPHPGRHRRLHQSVPHPHPPTARQRGELQVLRRLGHHRPRTRRDRRGPEDGVIRRRGRRRRRCAAEHPALGRPAAEPAARSPRRAPLLGGRPDGAHARRAVAPTRPHRGHCPSRRANRVPTCTTVPRSPASSTSRQDRPGNNTAARSRAHSGDDHSTSTVTRSGHAEPTTSSAPEPRT